MSSREERFAFWMSITPPLLERKSRSASMTVLLGPEGSGKTALVQRWLESLREREASSPRVWYSIARPREKPKPFCQRLLRELGREPGSSVAHLLWNELGAAQNVVYELTDWASKHKAAHLSQAVLVEVSNESVADAVCGMESLRKLGVRRIAPRWLAVPDPARLLDVRQALLSEGVAVRILGES
jgi:AAA domain